VSTISSHATRRGLRRLRLIRHPAQAVVVAFAAVILLGTLLLMLPFARTGEGAASFLTALFTSTSATCVTGLVTVDTPTYWSGFGEGVILALIQVGGFGIMTLASLLGLLVFRRLGLRSRLTASVEHGTEGLGDVRQVVQGVIAISLIFEAAVMVPLTLRFWLGYGHDLGHALYLGLFHSVSSFNNAGFALWSDNLMQFVVDPWVCLPIALSVIAGGLGFPVWLELFRRYRLPRRWSVHTKMTLGATALLLLIGTLFLTVNEWDNPGTLGPLHPAGKVLAGFFQGGVQPRTAGFNSLDMADLDPGSLLVMDVLMLIGGGSAGTAGGIKVTTFVLLFFVIYAEVRGERNVEAFRRRIGERAIRQALTVALLGVGLVMSGTIALLSLTDFTTDQVLMEAASAFGTVGLSTGITYDMPAAGQVVLMLLMFVGRLGPITLVSALALRDRERLHELPEGRPLIG